MKNTALWLAALLPMVACQLRVAPDPAGGSREQGGLAGQEEGEAEADGECGECTSDQECADGTCSAAAGVCLPSCDCPACTVCAGHCEEPGSCGDGVCGGDPANGGMGESCQTCPADCGDCDDCVPSPDGSEVCGDGVDNDCDGAIDEDCPSPCGGMTCPPGTICDASTGLCVPSDGGTCGDGVCGGDPANGGMGESCETCPRDCGDCDDCVPSPDGSEVCDGVDNDCDGEADEGCPVACGGGVCGPGEVCIHPVSCPVGPELEPSCIAAPAGCGTPGSCDCFPDDVCGNCATCGSVTAGQLQCDCLCICAAPDTPIATPYGERAIASLRPGDLVYSRHLGRVAAVPLRRVGRTAAPERHAIVRILLATGAVLEMSPGHPTADGRRFGDLAASERLDGVPIQAVETLPYGQPFTHDILPDSDTGTYYAAGVLVGSTLFFP